MRVLRRTLTVPQNRRATKYMYKEEKGIVAFIHKIEKITIIRAVRNGLVNMIPVLIIGAFALVIKSFPVEVYQTALTEFAGGFFLDILNLIYSATFGVLSVYMTYFISRAYMKIKADKNAVEGGAVVASLISFFILAGAYLPDFGIDDLGPKSMLLAIVTGLGASYLYHTLVRAFGHRRFIFSPGADHEFNRMLSTIIPVALVTIAFAVLNAVVVNVFPIESFSALIASFFNWIFSFGAGGFFKGLLFVALSSILWMFGVHGSDALEGVMQTYFVPGLAENQAAVAAGQAPSAILTKEFFDCFVLMGGCGSAICLLIAILLFSRSRSRKGLGLASTVPMLFNINEMMIFGLPVVFNPAMLIPFLVTPLVCYTTSYIAISTGLVPMITGSVEWTTPIMLGGYMATGSISGSVLQLVNLVIGVLIYLPFVKLLDRQTDTRILRNYAAFMDYYRKNEQELEKVNLLDSTDMYGDFAKGLCADIKHGMRKHLTLAYQPQYHYDGRCVGVEALLRWNHPILGMLYPPIVIKLAEEGGFLPELEESVLLRALYDRPEVLRRFGEDIHISVNVTGPTAVSPRFIQFCRQMNALDPFRGKNICLEVTEKAAIDFNKDTEGALRALRDMGIILAIDDFSMGQTSLNYLKDNMFGIIKLDGSLVKGLFTHQNCREIIFSISQLASSLKLVVLAEYVETEEQRGVLHEIGCDCYQGYLYSPAVFLNDPVKPNK